MINKCSDIHGPKFASGTMNQFLVKSWVLVQQLRSMYWWKFFISKYHRVRTFLAQSVARSEHLGQTIWVRLSGGLNDRFNNVKALFLAHMSYLSLNSVHIWHIVFKDWLIITRENVFFKRKFNKTMWIASSALHSMAGVKTTLVN